MATTKQATAQEIGRALAEALRHEAIVEGVWVDEVEDGVDLWILTQPNDDRDTEHRIYEIGVEVRRRFPDRGVSFSVINPVDWLPGTEFFGAVIPPSACQVEVAAP